MRIVLAVAVACLTMGSWHWQPLLPGTTPAAAGDAREIFTGAMTLDTRTTPFTRVASRASL